MTTQLEIFKFFKIKEKTSIVKGDTYNRTKDILSSAITEHGWVAFAGPIGSGKTVTIYNALQELRNHHSIAFVEIKTPNRKGITEVHLMHSILLELGEQFLGDTSIPRTQIAQSIKVERLIAKAKTKGFSICLIIDEAQEMQSETFNVIKRFRDVKLMNTGNTLSVILLGQSSLHGKIEQNEEVTLRCKNYDFQYTSAELVKIALHYGQGLLDEDQAREVAKRAVNGRGQVTPLSVKRSIEDAMENAYKVSEESLSMYHFEFLDAPKKAVPKSRNKIEVKAGAAKQVSKKYTKNAS